ncbi:hypothetical protein FRC12_004875 [Ceratobasidium sp. 428]|nr:hypothetical protein FRC12_004875 [Ceratobasidium sp. 428]
MPESQTSGRVRRPSWRLKEYDQQCQGPLKSLSKSVGRQETPPTAESQAAERAKKQAAVAKARGNTSLPGPLKPLTREDLRMDEEDELAEEGEEGEEDGDNEPGEENEPGEVDIGEDDNDAADRSLLDYQLEDLADEADRIEWLYLAIERLGGRHDYRNDLAFLDERSLRAEMKQLVSGGSAPHRGAPMSGDVRRIQTGMTHVLKPPTSGQSSRVQLVRTDDETIGLDRKRVGTEDHHEYGRPTPAKLTRTDTSTITLDGTVVSPPRRHAPANPAPRASANTVPRTSANPVPRAPANPVPRPSQPTATKRTHDQETAPSKKRAVVLLARIHALRKENKKLTAGTSAGPASKKSSTSSKPKPAQVPRSPPSDVEMRGLLGNEPEPAAPKVNRKDRRLAPQDDGAGNAGDSGEEVTQGEGVEQGEGVKQGAEQGEEVEQGAEQGEEVEQGNNNDLTTPKLTMRQRSQLAAFTPEATELVQYCMDKIKLDMFTICPFPETLTPSPKDKKVYLDHWLVKYWTKGHEELREGQPFVPMKDVHAAFIRNQLAPIRNNLRKSCEALVSVYFELQQGEDDVAKRAQDLTDKGNEKWISPNEEDDDERFKHPIIQNTIVNAFFRTHKSFGHTHLEGFTPLVPIPTIAYTCSIIRNRIKSYEVTTKNAELDSASDSGSFTMYMKMLEDTRKANPGNLLDARLKITAAYLKTQPKANPALKPKMTFGRDRGINMSQLEAVEAMLPAGAPPIADWDGVKDVKGKGKAPADDSDSD